jgi:fatty acid desaturase
MEKVPPNGMTQQPWALRQYAIDAYAAADREFVRSLRFHSPSLVMRKTVYLWVQVLTAWSIVAFARPIFWLPALVILVACQQTMATWVHEASHYNLFHDKRLNDLWCNVLLGAPIGMNVEAYRLNHTTHHNHLSSERDKDAWVHGTDWKGFGILREITLNALGYYGLKIALSKYAPALTRATEETGPKSGTRRYEFLVAAVFWNGLFFGSCLLTGRWYCYFLLWLYPLFSISQFINFLRTSAEHQPPGFPVVALSANPLVRTTIPSALEKWFIYGINFNYHLEHHLWPYVPFFNLPALHLRLIEQGYYGLHPDLLQRSAFARVWHLSKPNVSRV